MPATTMRSRIAIIAVPLLLTSCVEAYPDAYAPKEASFALRCADGCGKNGQEATLHIDVSFGEGERSFVVCCEAAAEVQAQLRTAQDHWCDGLDVPDAHVADLKIGTTISDTSGKRAVTLDQGEGYVAFQCGEWLDQLNAELDKSRCCL